jgi:hypothetical protein
LACTLLASSAAAKDPATFRYKPPANEERPVVVEGTVGPQGSDFALRLRFDKPPWGPQCGNRCANVTLLLDTDATEQTGMRLGSKAPENGADLAIVIQGARDWGESSESYLRVKVRVLDGACRNVDDGELVVELDHRRDPERVYLEGNTVFLLIDATSSTLPSGHKTRIIYHPPGSKALQATGPGLLSGSARNSVMIFRRGGWGKAPQIRKRD